ncbi:hypothetical protein D3C72_1090120 [compost metagenome]
MKLPSLFLVNSICEVNSAFDNPSISNGLSGTNPVKIAPLKGLLISKVDSSPPFSKFSPKLSNTLSYSTLFDANEYMFVILLEFKTLEIHVNNPKE